MKKTLLHYIFFAFILTAVLACVSICFSPAKAQTCLNSLQDAVNAIGSAQETLEVTPGTWAVASSLYIPENISLKVYKGAIIDIGSGATLTIAGSLEAGDYRIFGGSGMVDLPAGHVNVVWFTSGGNGTTASPWVGAQGKGGIGEAFERVVPSDLSEIFVGSFRAFVLPAGEYSVTDTIYIYGLGPHFIGRVPSISSQEGSRTHIHFSPSTPKTLFNITMPENSATGDCGVQGWHEGIQGVYLTSNNPGGEGHIAIRSVAVSMATFRDIAIDNWSGTGIESRGMEITTFDRIRSKAAKPLVISENPFCSSIDEDAHYFRDMEMIGTANTAGSAIVTVTSSCRLSEPKGMDTSHDYFLGFQVWQGNQHGFYWVESCDDATDLDLTISNVQSKNASPSGGYLNYMDRTGSGGELYDFYIENCDGSDRSGGFSYTHRVRNIHYASNSYHNGGYFMYGYINFDLEAIASSLSDSAKIYFNDLQEVWAPKGGTREKLPRAIYLRSP